MDQSLKVSQPEKKFLREAFVGLLPDEILWRQKNGMSDAVGYNWVDTIKEYTKSLLNSEEFLHVCYNSGTHNKPQSFEEAVYRAIFWDRFGQQDHLISEIWRPRWTTVTDPSARQLSVFSDDTC